MEHLLAHVLRCRRLDLYLRFNESLTEPDLVPLRALLKRRGKGEPLQHVLGTVEFHNSEFVCDGRALIPRPETEFLVEHLVKKRFRDRPPRRILDMGTGTGCIGLSLAKAWPGAEITLADISEDALELARLNTEKIGVSAHRARLLRSDLFEKIEGEYDLITANLPYIPRSELPALSREVHRDPILALDGGDSGLEIIHRFIAECLPHLSAEGCIALELHHDQANALCEHLQQRGFRGIESTRDLAGIERFVFALRPPAGVEDSEPKFK